MFGGGAKSGQHRRCGETTPDTSIPSGVSGPADTPATAAADAGYPLGARSIQAGHGKHRRLQLTFDTQGAQLVKAQLHHYTATNNADQPMVLLDKTPATPMWLKPAWSAVREANFPTHLTPHQLVSVDEDKASGTTEVVFQVKAMVCVS